MSESLKTTIQEDVKTAMRAKDKERLGVLRQVTAAIKQREVDERIELDEAATLAVLEKMLKQRRDAHEQFDAAGREDLASKEAFEIGIIEAYMPQPLSEAELEEAIQAAISSTGAETMRDMGKVMGILKGQVQGRADLGQVSAKVRALLG